MNSEAKWVSEGKHPYMAQRSAAARSTDRFERKREAILDAATRIQRALGGGAIDVQPWPKEYEAVESGDFVVDTTKLRRLLGWAPAYSFDAGLACVKARALSARLVPGSECEPLNAALTQSVTPEGYR